VIKPEFLVARDGQSVILYAGLLDLAHRQGLRALRTHLLQIPHEENARTAIVRAEVETERGTVSGLGDASPATVAAEFLPEIWQILGAEAGQAGQGGRDFCVVRDFVRSIVEDTVPPIDVYRALDFWPGSCSGTCCKGGGRLASSASSSRRLYALRKGPSARRSSSVSTIHYIVLNASAA
jgi:hypothetical protein